MQFYHSLHNEKKEPRILFAEDFDEPISTEIVSPPDSVNIEVKPIDAGFTASDIEAARNEGYDRGRLECLQEASQQRFQLVDQVFMKIEIALQQAIKVNNENYEKSIKSISRLIFGILTALLPATCAKNATREISETVRDVMESLLPTQGLCVEVAPAIAEEVRNCLKTLSVNNPNRLALAENRELQNDEVKLTWDTGAATRATGKVHKAILEILERMGLIEPPAPQPDVISRTQIPSHASVPDQVPDRLSQKVTSEDV